MSPKTEAALAEIRRAAAAGQTIVPGIFSHFYGRAAVSAAFRIAKRAGIIEEVARSVVDTPIYKAAGYSAAVAEAATAVKH